MSIRILIGMCCMALLIFVAGCAMMMPATPLVPTGIIYTGVTGPGDVRLGDYPDYEVIGPAEGESSALGVLGIIATGDAGVGEAYGRAIRKTRADALIDVQVDHKVFSILGLFSKHTTIVQGTAVKFISKD